MILVVGLTSAWQRVYRLPSLKLGEVNRASGVAECASGKGLNVAVSLHLLGAPCTTISLLGGPARDRVESELASLGIDRRWIDTAAHTRTCTTVLDEANRQVTELVENAGPVSDHELAEFRRVFANETASASLLVLTGSLPAGAPTPLYAELLAQTQCPTILDIRGPELLAALEHRPLVVKPNREELAATLGRPLDADEEVERAIHELFERGAQWAIISSGSQAGWIGHCDSPRLERFQPLRLSSVVNTIGCGDALVAGLAAGIAQGRSPREALPRALAVAAASALHVLPGRFEAADVEAINTTRVG